MENQLINGYHFGRLLKSHKENVYIVYKDNKMYVSKLYHNFYNFIQEYYYISKLDHPNIIKIHDIYISDNIYYIFTDYYPYNIESKIIIGESLEKKWIYQLADVILYLHSNNIVHQDIKLDNIMLDDDYNLILIDFDLSNTAGLENTFVYNKNIDIYPKFDTKICNKYIDIWMFMEIIKTINKKNIILKYNYDNIYDLINSEYFTLPQGESFIPTKYIRGNEYIPKNCLKIFDETININMIDILNNWVIDVIDECLKNESYNLKFLVKNTYNDLFNKLCYKGNLKISRSILQLFGLSIIYIVFNIYNIIIDSNFLVELCDNCYTLEVINENNIKIINTINSLKLI